MEIIYNIKETELRRLAKLSVHEREGWIRIDDQKVNEEIQRMIKAENIKLYDCPVDPTHNNLPPNLNFLT